MGGTELGHEKNLNKKKREEEKKYIKKITQK